MPWSLTRMAFAVDDTSMPLTNEQMSVRFAWVETLKTWALTCEMLMDGTLVALRSSIEHGSQRPDRPPTWPPGPPGKYLKHSLHTKAVTG
jgi:hypothetical protein